MTPLRRALLANDLLDPDDAHELQQRLAARPQPRRAARAALPLRRPAWRIPPPAMGWPARLRSPALLGEDDARRVRIGDRFQIHIDDLPDPEGQVLVILQRIGLSDWTVLSPISGDRLHTLSRCRKTADGARQIDLLARGPVGPQRWAVALLPAPLDVDFTLPAPQRWAGIQRLIAQGAVRVCAVDVEVIAAQGAGSAEKT